MRFLRKLAVKFITMIIMVALMGALMRYARPALMKSAGLPAGMPAATSMEGVHFSSEESDLMATVFKSAIRLLTGSASRKELAGELSNKLYAGRADAATMKELGIELVQPGGGSPVPGEPTRPGTAPAVAGDPLTLGTAPSAPSGMAGVASSTRRTNPPTQPTTATLSGANPGGSFRHAFLARLQSKAMANPELALAPVVLTGMLLVHGIRRRRSPSDDFILPDMAALIPSDSEPYEMTHPVHALRAEDFELLVALIYQRQGYRVTMPAGLSGGHGIDFTLQRKSERLLVQCKNMRQDHRLPIERVRELHEAVTAAGATRGLFVASCGFTWDARNFAKSKGLIVINARTLDALITEAREDESEDLLAVAAWAPKFMTKVKLTPPTCPTCEAEMEWTSASGGTVWVCSQRPDCRGRRSARKYQAAVHPAAQARATAFAKITESIQFTKLTRLIKPAPIRLAEPVKPVTSVKPIASAKPAAPVKLAESVRPVVSAKPVAPAKPVASAVAVAAKPDLASAPATPAAPVASTKPTAAAKLAKLAASVKLAKLVEAIKPGVPAKPEAAAEEPAPPARLLEVFPNPKRQPA